MKKCNTCLEDKSSAEFYKHTGRSKDGLYGHCKVCAKDRGTKRRLRRRAKIEALKLKLGCCQCGYKDHPHALQWDHIDPSTKSDNVPQYYAGGLKRLFKEIRKCQVLCANCHSIKSVKYTRTSLQAKG